MEAWSSSRRLESAGWRRRTAGFQVLPAAALFSSPSPLFPPARCCDGASPCGSIGVISRVQLPPFPRAAPAPYLSLPARASLRVFLLRAQGASLLSPARAPALALEGRLGVRADALATPSRVRRRHTQERRGGRDASIGRSPGRLGVA